MMSEETNSSMLVLTNTYLSPSICYEEVYMEGFQIYRTGGEDGRAKDGITIYLLNCLTVDFEKYDSGSDGGVEYLMLNMKKFDLVVIAMYNPPRTPQQGWASCGAPQRYFLALGYPSSSLAICCDFNIPRIN